MKNNLKYITFIQNNKDINHLLFKYFSSILFIIKYNLDYKVIDNINNLEEFIFYKGVDSIDNDYLYLSKKSIEELKNICTNNENIVGFNTLGFLKTQINLNNLISNQYINEHNNHGLYYKNILKINNNNFLYYLDHNIINLNTNIIIDEIFENYNELIKQKEIIIKYIEEKSILLNHSIILDNKNILIKDIISYIKINYIRICNFLNKPINCYICGCIRNSYKYIENVYKNIIKISKLFNNYKIIIVYDESTDRTLEMLLKLKEKNSNIEIIINKNKLSNYKTENISNARNSILNYIKKENNSEFEYFIMMDLDDVCEKDINTDILKKTFLRDDWDGITFNRSEYYDIWALSIDPFLISCWHMAKEQMNSCFYVEIIRKYIVDKLNNLNENELLDCKSSFNGFGLYKKDKFINCNYSNNIFKSLSYLSIDLINKNISKLNEITKIENNLYVNLLEDCEHRSFHFEAIEKNNSRIKISPHYLFYDLDKFINNYNTKYGKISLYKNEIYIGDSFDKNIYWDEDTLLKLKKYINPDRNILEIGGHCGTSTIVYSTFLNNNKKIYVFEPQKNMYNLLVKNINQNNLEYKIIPYNKGLFCYNGIGIMNDIDLDGGGGIVSKRYNEEIDMKCNYGGIGLGKNGEKIYLTTIDSLNLDDIGFIHCDAQGSENFIFSKSINTIRKFRPIILYENNQLYAKYLYDNVCNSYPEYKENSLFDIKKFCMNELNYSLCIDRFNNSIDCLLIP